MSSPDVLLQPAASSTSAGVPDALWPFDNSFARLPPRFYARVQPTKVRSPRLIHLNVELARSLGLEPGALLGERGAQIFSGNNLPQGADPIALAYAGHQFGYFVPQLGDGRAILLGEVLTSEQRRFDVQLKGAGRTSFSRAGDGRAALGPVLREYLVSEAMHALGVPTTRALAAVVTGETVQRETPLPGAIFTRVAASHLRVGTFQFFAARSDVEGLKTLADYAIARHYPEAAEASSPHRAFLDCVITRQARLVAQWLQVGFIHGVMNTDNCAISGETIDYGPCAFMEAYDPDQVFSSIDMQGRYAYANQPSIALWNLTRLAETLLPLLEQQLGNADLALASVQEALSAFAPQFHAAYLSGLRRKLGFTTEQGDDAGLAQDLLNVMAAQQADFTLTFRSLASAAGDESHEQAARSLFANPSDFDQWVVRWRARLQAEPLPPHMRAKQMLGANPAYIPRNHRIQQVITAAVERDDFQPFERLLALITHPFDDQPGFEAYMTPAAPTERITQTFCGT